MASEIKLAKKDTDSIDPFTTTERKDGFERSGCKRVETKLPNLLKDIESIVEPTSQR
jgi:hypothetical protein